MPDAKTHEQLRAELIDRASQDEDFRARLIDDPKAAISDALGITVPNSISVTVHQDTATTAHLVLPPAAKLDDADLQAIAGGHRLLDMYGSPKRHSHDSGKAW